MKNIGPRLAMLAAAGLAVFASEASLKAQAAQPAVQAQAAGTPWNDSAEMRRYIDALIAKMTLKEKIGQLTMLTSGWESTGPTMRDSYKQDIAAGNVGGIFNAFIARYTRELQADIPASFRKWR